MNVWEIHPALVHFPIALLLSAIAVDVFVWWRGNVSLDRVATGLLIAGVAAGWLAANFGLLAFYTVPAHTHEAHRLMFWHIGAAVTTLALFTWLAVVRWFHRAEPVTRIRHIVGIVGAAILMTTGALGGYIVYHGGAGVEPELLAESVRESHTHGRHDRVAGRDEQNGHGRERRQSYYTAPSNQDDHGAKPDEDGGQHSMKNHRGPMKDGEKKSGHGNHEHKQDAERDSKPEAPHKEEQHKEDSATKQHDHDQPAEMDEQPEHGREQSDKAAAIKHDDQGHGHAEKHKTDESKTKPTAGHQHDDSRPKDVPRPKDPPLGPDFERNVQDNRQRNRPKTDDRSMKEHGRDEAGKDKSGSKHQH
jgi:uncharacterized membrane protein